MPALLALVEPGRVLPPAWHAAQRVRLPDDPDLALELVRDLLERAEPVAVEVPPGLAATLDEPCSVTTPAHLLGPLHTMAADHLRAWFRDAGTDLRADGRWWLLDEASSLGARPVTVGPGDLELPDGRRVHLDGGPLRHRSAADGIPVLHRIAVEHGSLEPFGPADPDPSVTARLAADQLAAIAHPGGSARVIAPAGSGKTTVLTERARHLVRRWRLPAAAITLVAYNRRAQEEMAARTADLPGLGVYTLNAIALAIVNGTPPFARRSTRCTTITETEVRRLIGRLVDFPRRRNSDPVAVWIEALSAARLGLRDGAEVEASYGGEVDGFADFLGRYRRELAERSLLDFDEQILVAVETLLAEPTVRAAAQCACRVMLVDEFQDLTPAALLLVRLLAGADGAVFGVGDDDQTIYGYNGADPAWLIDFDRAFPGAGEHPLTTNYRCPGGIVTAARHLLGHNTRRVRKEIRSVRPTDDGFEVVAPTDDTVGVTVGRVTAAVARGVAPTDIAVLTRVNSLLAPVHAALVEAGVPVRSAVGPEFADRTSVAAVLAWLRLTVGDLDAADLGEALRRPPRSLHPRIAEWVVEQRSIDGLRRLAGRLTNERDARTLGEFVDDIVALRGSAGAGATTAELVDELFGRTTLADAVGRLDTRRRGMNRTAQGDDIEAVRQLAGLHRDPTSFDTWLRTVLHRGGAEGVTLSTVHRVKGQEWPFVVVHHVADDQFPHRLAEDVEEERRLFHVAITRAARKVIVVPSSRPSPFVDECSTDAPPAAPATAPRPAATQAAARTARSRPDEELFGALRELRIALAAGKPAYTVFPDSVLHELVDRRPTSRAEMARIPGVGPVKLERYADEFLAVVARSI